MAELTPAAYALNPGADQDAAKLKLDEGVKRILANRYILAWILHDTASNYDDLRKVYSVWICFDVPKPKAGTIAASEMQLRQILGRYPDEGDYDLLTVVMVCLEKEDESMPFDEDRLENSMMDMLRTIFSVKIGIEDKRRILERRYGIPMTRDTGEEVDDMCNYSSVVERRGIEKGIERGIQQGVQDTLRRSILNMRAKGYADEVISDCLQVSVEEISGILAGGPA